MKLREISRTLAHSTIILTCLSTYAQATPLDALTHVIHLAERQLQSGVSDILLSHQKRQCANPCGYYGQLCCQTGQSCVTDSAGQAQCAAGAAIAQPSGAGSWQVYTSTWVETGLVTKTSVYSSWLPAATGGSSAKCDFAANEAPCGTTCCKSGFYCYASNQCVAAGNGGFTTAGVVGTIPARPTTISGVIVTQTVSPTTTMAFQTPVTTGAANATITGQGHGLSGGAIAGIVIGVLLGLALLWLLIFCLCLDACLKCLGIRKKKRSRGSRTEVVEEEEYIRHHRHGASAAGGGRMWVGGSRRSSSDRHSRPSRPPGPPPKKKTGWLGALAAGAATAAAVSFFNKGKKKKSEKSSSSYTGSSYDSYYSYDDSLESRSRGSRLPSAGPRGSRYTSRTRSVRH